MIKGITLTAFLFASTVSASVITLDATDNGWYDNSGQHTPSNQNTWTGTDAYGTYRNSFYNFDVSGLFGTNIKSVQLTFFAANGYIVTPDSTETLQIWDVTTTPGLGNSVDVYNDLMSGVLYAQQTISGAYEQVMPAITINLSPSSFNDILFDGFFSVGAHLSSLSPDYRQVFWSSSFRLPAAQLTVEYSLSQVSAPASLAMLVIGLAGFGFTRNQNMTLKAIN